MASTLQKGSSGSQVKKLQTMLGQAGYQLNASGTYDDATANAVKQYQASQGMAGSGVFDNATLKNLYKSLANQQTQQAAQQQAAPTPAQEQKVQTTPAASEDTAAQLQKIAQGYQPSQEVQQARQQLANTQAAKPQDYASQYEPMINQLFDQIVNRGKFQYDVNGDALYDMYKDRYIRGGRLAMEDTMGKAANLTGGYGNTYAQQVGQQTYDEYMAKLADKVPELEQMAYERWAEEGDRLGDQLNLAMQRENQDYSRWGDEYNRWLQGLQYDTDRADTLDQQDYNRWADDRDYWANRENTEYNRSDEQLKQQQDIAYDMAMTMIKQGVMPSEDALLRAGINAEDAQAYADMVQQAAAAQAAAKSSGRGGGGGGKSASKKITDDQISTAMRMYAGNPDSVVPYLDKLEYQGYDVDWLIDYLDKYGRLDETGNERKWGQGGR